VREYLEQQKFKEYYSQLLAHTQAAESCLRVLKAPAFSYHGITGFSIYATLY
jgi:hypothetical protein